MRRTAAGAAAAALLATGTGVISLAAASPARAAGGSYYLALGDSLAAGYQPGAGDHKSGGYVGDVLATLKQRDAGTTLTNLACSGETTVSLASGTKCSYPAGNQLAAAVAFLKSHAGERGVITLDIGANDVQDCATTSTVDLPCVMAGLAAVGTNLPGQVAQLRAAAPNATIILLNYYNPFLAAWLTGTDGRTLAKSSVALQRQLNGAITGAAKASNASVADVAAAFKSEDFTATETVEPFGPLPINVAKVCGWTWMCTKGDIHTNDTGYAVLASAVRPLLPAWTTQPSSPTTSSSATGSSSSSSAVTGPPVVTDGAAADSNVGVLVGAGLAGVGVAAGAGVLVRRTRR